MIIIEAVFGFSNASFFMYGNYHTTSHFHSCRAHMQFWTSHMCHELKFMGYSCLCMHS